MKISNFIKSSVLVSASVFITVSPTFAATQPDNSAVNQRDQSPHEMRAQDQSESKTDVELTRKIRQAIMAQKGFSTYAQNIKIITSNGQVTLKGPVKDAHEKTQIETLAKQVAGNSKVMNQIEIKE